MECFNMSCPHPAASLVVVEVHQLAGAVQAPGDFIGFSLADVDKVLSKSAQGDTGRLAAASRGYRYLEDIGMSLTCSRTRCCPHIRPRSTPT